MFTLVVNSLLLTACEKSPDQKDTATSSNSSASSLALEITKITLVALTEDSGLAIITDIKKTFAVALLRNVIDHLMIYTGRAHDH